jgi:prolyl oligopeptidase
MFFNPLTRFTALVCLFATALFMIQTNNYPAARKSDQVDDYHGTKVADPYRWLEDLDSAETAKWVEAQNKLTFGFLNSIPRAPDQTLELREVWRPV